MRKGLCYLLVLALALCLCACGQQASPAPAAEPASPDAGSENSAETAENGGLRHAEITIRDYGTVKLELDASAAPITVENFCRLAQAGFYDGLTFHRIVDNFMIQGGDPKGDGSGGTNTIEGEFSANGFDNPISHTRGVVSMARRSNDMNSASCQFFICYSDMYKDDLDGQYAAFGKVIDGMLFLDTLTDLECELGSDGRYSKPVKKVTIKSSELFNVTKGESAVYL